MPEVQHAPHNLYAPADFGEADQWHKIETAFVGDNDLSALTPRRLADYHMAVTAVQLDGQSVFLDGLVREQAEACVAQTEQELLVAAGDAITRELLPGGMTGIPVEGEGTGAASDRNEVKEFLTNEAIVRRYKGYVSDDEWSGLWRLVQDMPVSKSLGEPVTRMTVALRRRLESVRDDRQSVIEVVDDIAQLSHMVFGARVGMANETADPEVVNRVPQPRAARRIAGLLLSKLRTKRPEVPQTEGAQTARVPERGWHAFSSYVHDLCGTMMSGDFSMQVIMATRVIGSAHDNGPILERFTRERAKAKEYLATLDATMGSYEQLAEHGSYLSLSLLGYMTGRRKSLHAIPQGKAVPPQFTGLSG